MRKLKPSGIAAGLLLGLAVLWSGLGPALATGPTMSAAQEEGRAWLGLQLANLGPRLAQRLGPSRQEGVVILRVLPQGPAAQAGLQARDIILEINGQRLTQVTEAIRTVGQAKPGDKMTLKVWRGGEERPFEVTLGSAPTPKPPQDRPRPLPLGGFLRERLGGVENLFERFLGGQLSFQDKDGQRVTLSIVPGTVAALTADSITVTPHDGGSQTFRVTGDTKVAKGGRAIAASELRVGDPVVIIGTRPGVADLIVGWSLPQEIHRPFPRRWGERPR